MRRSRKILKTMSRTLHTSWWTQIPSISMVLWADLSILQETNECKATQNQLAWWEKVRWFPQQHQQPQPQCTWKHSIHKHWSLRDGSQASKQAWATWETCKTCNQERRHSMTKYIHFSLSHRCLVHCCFCYEFTESVLRIIWACIFSCKCSALIQHETEGKTRSVLAYWLWRLAMFGISLQSIRNLFRSSWRLGELHGDFFGSCARQLSQFIVCKRSIKKWLDLEKLLARMMLQGAFGTPPNNSSVKLWSPKSWQSSLGNAHSATEQPMMKVSKTLENHLMRKHLSPFLQKLQTNPCSVWQKNHSTCSAIIAALSLRCSKSKGKTTICICLHVYSTCQWNHMFFLMLWKHTMVYILSNANAGVMHKK